MSGEVEETPELSNAEPSNKPSAIEIIHRDPLQVTVADINRLYFSKTDAHPDLLHRALNLTALPQNWKDDLMLRAQSRYPPELHFMIVIPEVRSPERACLALVAYKHDR